MPKISEFHGIVIRMHLRGEHPPPHFHIEYAGREAKFDIRALKKTEGSLPPPQLRLVRTWAKQHQNELLENFARAMAKAPLSKIEPWR